MTASVNDEPTPLTATSNTSNSILDDIRTIVKEGVDDKGRRIKTTTRSQSTHNHTKIPIQVHRRLNIPKFGDAAKDPPGPCISSTIMAEPVTLKLSMKIDHDQVPTKPAALEVKTIVCKYCKGAHWSAKCPYKETFREDFENASTSASDASKAAKAGKYIPPAQRKAMEQGIPLSTSGRDNPYTLRITNLSSICTDSDIRDLVTRICPVQRVYVSKDYRTGECRGSAFVSFNSQIECDRVLRVLDGRPYGNLILAVEMAKPQPPRE